VIETRARLRVDREEVEAGFQIRAMGSRSPQQRSCDDVGWRPAIRPLWRTVPMKSKLSIAFALALFAGSFAIGTAEAQDPACMRACRLQLQACLLYTPDKAELCYAYDAQCRADCGAFN
jgi:hypothetical protein